MSETDTCYLLYFHTPIHIHKEIDMYMNVHKRLQLRNRQRQWYLPLAT